VRKLIKKVGQELLEDEEHGPQFLDALKSQGVNRMDDSAFVVRCKFSAKPGNQWALRRVAYAKIQEAFARAGIKFAPKRVVVEAITPDLAAAGAAVSTMSATEAAPDDRG
jgi:small-conductance mechanosensitive channel